ncbi:hypothetical protein PMAYCL1PPCAC_16530, partial [Pristionchus mayeri]
MPSEQLRMTMTASIRGLHDTNSSDFHVFGFPCSRNETYSAFDAIAFDVLPSYTTSYALLCICTVKIRSHLTDLGSSISSKTIKMQQHFWQLQISQV